MSYPRYRTRL